MKRSVTFFTLLSAFLLLFLSGFTFSTNEEKQIKGDDILNVDPFTKISISLPARVNIEQATPRKLSIDTDAATMEKIEAKVNDGTLYLKLKKPFDKIKGEVTINITIPDLNEISVSGSATVMTKSTFRTDKLSLQISGSGEIQFDDLISSALESKISGSGKIILTGQSDEFDAAVVGSGKIDAFGFEVKEFDGKISGSGECNVNVTSELGATIAGSGRIIYKGNPKVNSSVSGSGKVKSAD